MIPRIASKPLFPYLRKLKHGEYERKANGYSELEGIPLETLTNWMTEYLRLGFGGRRICEAPMPAGSG